MSRVIRPALDLSRYAWTQRHGDLTVYGTWWYDNDDNQWVPCLVIVPTFSVISNERVTPCVVTLDLAWIWSEEEGSPRFAAETAASFCDSLGMAVNPKNAIRVAGIIRDHLEDLIKRIPPRPPQNAVVADAIVTNAAGRERHAEIREDV